MDKAVWKTEIFLLFIVTKEFRSTRKMEIFLELYLESQPAFFSFWDF
jgi:hypothetical protein